MVKVTIEIPDNLATAFQEAVVIYNVKNETMYNAKQVLRQLLRGFAKDTLHAARIETANEAAEEELKDI